MQTTVHSEIISKGYNKLIKGFKPFFFLFLLVLFADLKIVNAQIDFDPSPVSGCTPLNVTCTNLTSNPMAYFYRWDFNDGSPIIQDTLTTALSHMYINSGTYNINMIVYDNAMNLLGSITKSIQANGLSSWDQLYLYPDNACPNEDISISAPWGYQTYIYDKGDGSPNDTLYNNWMNYRYSTPGTYNASVTLLNTCGGLDTTLFDTITINSTMSFPNWISINSWPTVPCPGENINFYGPFGFASYVWDFGDGNPPITSSSDNVIHQYSLTNIYTVTLQLFNYCGDDTTITYSQTIQYPPFPSGMTLNANPTPACPGEKVNFGTSLGYVQYVWNYGDGSLSDTTSYSYNDHNYAAIGTYTASVTITQLCGNDTTLTTIVNINSSVSFPSWSNLSAYPNLACPFETINLNTLWGYPYYEWNFGDGTPIESGSIGNKSHVFTAPGTYISSVKVTNLCGNDTTLTDTLSINSTMPFPSSIGFNQSNNPACPGDVSFHGTSGFQFYTWTFGDGSPSQTSNTNTLIHNYPNLGTYPISLKMVNYCGDDTTLYDILIIGYQPFPTNMAININSQPACPNKNISFAANWGYVSYDWDFGDGNTSTGSNYLNHKYTSVGVYLVSVKVHQLCGNDTTIVDTVTIINNNPIPVSVGFSTFPGTACPEETVSLNGPWGFAVYQWDLGDGFLDTTNSNYYTYTYTTAGDYRTSLRVMNYCGMDSVLYDSVSINSNLPLPNSVSLSAWYQNGTSACPSEMVQFNGPWGFPSYIWDYGDGTAKDSGSFQSMSHSFSNPGTYTISLIVTNLCGNDSILYTSVFIDDNKPFGMVNFNASMTPVCPGEKITFTAQQGYAEYIWNYGDGTPLDTTTSNEIKHSYDNAGTFTATVTIVDYCGQETTLNTNVWIDDALMFPMTSVSVFPNPVCPNQDAQFSTDKEHLAYFWDFGDGVSAFGSANANHSYSALGTYDVSLTITSHCDIDSTFTSTLTVDTTTSFPPWMNFQVNPWQVCPGEIFNFSTEKGFNKYFWDFGNGDTLTTSGPSIDHIYDVAGTYSTSVTITNGCGNSTTLFTSAYVDNNSSIYPPQIFTQFSSYCPNDNVMFLLNNDMNSGGSKNYNYSWDFGDGNLDTTVGVGASHFYDSIGNYNVIVTISNACGNTSMLSVPVKIINNASPTLNENTFGTLSKTNIVGCPGDAVVFYFLGSSDNLWDFGDGSTGSATEVFMNKNGITLTVIKHAYSIEGTYSVQLTLTNSCGKTTTDSISIQILSNLMVAGGLILEPPSTTGSYTTCSSINMIGYGGSSYYWDFGDGNTLTTISPTISHVYSDAGSYSISVTITNGCGYSTTFSDAVTVIESDGITAVISISSAISCYAGSDGAAIVTGLGGLAPYNYEWDDEAAQSVATASNLAAGTYNVTVSDNIGCSTDTSITLSDPAAIYLSITSVNASCGNADGLASVNVDSGGVSPFTYLWSSGTSGTGLSAGNHRVIVIDNDGCSTETVFAISEQGGATVGIANPTDATCNGDADGALSANASGGAPPYTYTWSNGDSTAGINGLTAGNYVITITDASTCQTVKIATVNQPDELEATFIVVEAECGESNGSAAISISGGTSGYFYQWDSNAGSAITTSVSNLSANAYQVTITDVNSCTLTATATVGNSNSPSIEVLATDISCFGYGDGAIDISVTGGTTPYAYLWTYDNGSSFVEDLTGLEAGIYTIMIQDASNCWTGTSTTIEEPLLSSSISVTNPGCIGGNDGTAEVSVSDGYEPYTYLWSNSSTSSSISALLAGSYTVAITDSNGCSINDTAIVEDPLALAISIVPVDVSCNGGSDGEADLTVSGGSSPYTYLWNDLSLSTTEDIEVLSANTYIVTITDSCGASAVDSIIIAEPTLLTIAISATDVTCYGGGDGTATATPSGGTPPYNYMWNNNQTDSISSGLFPGLQAVNVFDANGCIASNNITISEPSVLSASVFGTDVSCISGSDGSVDLSVSNGTEPYTYLWSNGDSIEDITGIISGNYTVSITDSCGDSTTASLTIAEPAALTSSVVLSDVSCNAGTDGLIDLSVTGGTAPYSYLWSSADTIEDISGLIAGTYTVIISDTCGITIFDTLVIAEPTLLTTSISGINTTCFGLGDGSATVVASGGTPPYNYVWNNNQTSSAAIGLFAGNYSVNVFDANSCLASAMITITEPDDIELTIVNIDATCNNADGSATVTVAGGTAPFTYSWDDPGSQTNTAASALTSGSYMVNVIDTNGCMDSASITIGVMVEDQEICMVSVDSATGKYVVVWEKTNTAIDSFRIYRETSTTNIYELIGTQEYAAQSDFVDLYSYPEVKSELYKISAIDSCGNESVISDYHRSLHLVSALGTGNKVVLAWDNYIGFNFVKYRILRGTSQNNLTAMDSISSSISTYTDTMPPSLDSVFYQIEVIHPNGCFAQKTKNYNSSKSNTSSISTTSDLDASASSMGASADSCDGEATITATGGNSPYTYIWDSNAGNQTTQTADSLCSGNYYVTVFDANGDSVVTSVSVEIAGVTITATTTTVDANEGQCDGSATVSASGGYAPYTYIWDGNTGNQTGVTATDLCSGTYSVTVIDSLGNETIVFATVGTISGILEFVDGNNSISIYPNPYSGQTTISFLLNQKEEILLEIFSIIGERIAILENSERTSGTHSYFFSAAQLGYPRGIYMVQLTTNGQVFTRRLVELR